MTNPAARQTAIAVSMKLIEISAENYPAVARIYGEGLQTGTATFETTIPSWEKWNDGHLPFGRIIAVEDNNYLGWAALSPVSSRCVYGGVAEVSVYVDTNQSGRGIGTLLMKTLISKSESLGFWTLQSGIFPENIASVHLHERSGFRKIGIRERIGKMDGKWYDTLLMERRSSSTGID